MKSIEVVAAIIQHGDAILATQRGYGNYAGFWEFPGGKVEPGETCEQAIVREIREEMDAEIAVDTFVTTVETDYPEYHVTMHCYLAHLLSDFKLLEHSDARWVTSETIDSLDWLPTDVQVINAMKELGLLEGGLSAYYADKQFEFGWATLCWMNLPEDLEGLTVLDIGCRRGKGVFKFSDKVGQDGMAIGLDWVPEYIQEASSKSERAWKDTGLPRNNMQFVCGFPEDLKACGIQDESVDLVYINSVINLVFDPAATLAECARVLKPQGRLVLEAVTADCARDVAVVKAAIGLGNSVQSAPEKQHLLAMIAAAGLTVEETLQEHEVAADAGFKKDYKAPTAPSDEDVTFTAAVFHARKGAAQ